MSIYNKQVQSNKGFTRDFAKGKSFDFSEWNPARTYVNDAFKQDFVKYEGNIYVCIHTNTNVVPGTSRCWMLALEKLAGTAFVPSVDAEGNLSWSVYTGSEIPDSFNIKGIPGEKGEKGDKGEDGKDGINGIDGKDGVDGKDGKDGKDGRDGRDGHGGNHITFDYGLPETILNLVGAFGDVYVDLSTGNIFECESSWILKGSFEISSGGDVNLDWEDIGF